MTYWRHAKLRALVVPQGPPKDEEATNGVAAAAAQGEIAQARPQRISWARLLKPLFDIDMQRYPSCGGGGELKLMAAIPKGPVIQKILDNLLLDPQAPPEICARAGPHFAA